MSLAHPARSNTAQRLASAARVVSSVAHQYRSLDDSLQAEFARIAAGDRASVQALAYGTVRWWPRLDFYLAALFDKPATVAPLVRALVGVGLHQLEFSSHPEYAIVDETVEATRALQVPRAATLVNAVLRRFLREREALHSRAQKNAAALDAMPNWMVDRFRADWPADWQQIVAASNEPAPLWLRVNRRQVSAAHYCRELTAAGLSASLSEHAPEAVRLAEPVDVDLLPGFATGRVSVQDAAAQLTAQFMDVSAGMRVLDACAAPGGKACHLLETADIELIAVDSSSQRLEQVRENLERLRLTAVTVAGDATQPQAWWDGKPFDRILIDAPCTASGVIRRHPDIKLLRRAADIARLADQQRALLSALWPLLAVGGRMLYATCSLLRDENEKVAVGFADGTADANLLPLTLPNLGRSTPAGLQILTGEAGMDGFHYACLERRRT